MSEKDRARIVALLDDNISLINALERTSSSAARYKAALEQIVRIRPASANYDDAYWAGVNSGVAECQDIARRALHPEEGER